MIMKSCYKQRKLINLENFPRHVVKVPYVATKIKIIISDGKRPDGVFTVLWERGKLLVWYVICPDTLASPCLPLTTMNNCEVAAAAETQKLVKYAHLDCHFVQIDIETIGCMGPRTLKFLKDLGRRSSPVVNSNLLCPSSVAPVCGTTVLGSIS